MRANQWSATYILVEICSTNCAISIGRRTLEEFGSSTTWELSFYRNLICFTILLTRSNWGLRRLNSIQRWFDPSPLFELWVLNCCNMLCRCYWKHSCRLIWVDCSYTWLFLVTMTPVLCNICLNGLALCCVISLMILGCWRCGLLPNLGLAVL